MITNKETKRESSQPSENINNPSETKNKSSSVGKTLFQEEDEIHQGKNKQEDEVNGQTEECKPADQRKEYKTRQKYQQSATSEEAKMTSITEQNKNTNQQVKGENKDHVAIKENIKQHKDPTTNLETGQVAEKSPNEKEETSDETPKKNSSAETPKPTRPENNQTRMPQEILQGHIQQEASLFIVHNNKETKRESSQLCTNTSALSETGRSSNMIGKSLIQKEDQTQHEETNQRG